MKMQVWNMNPHVPVWKEKLNGEWWEIPYNSYIVKEDDEAHLFAGQYYPMERDAGGQQTKRSMKMIELKKVTLEDITPKAMKISCNVCRKDFQTQSELTDHSVEHESLAKEREDEVIARRRGRPARTVEV